jgi:hypothetical protein
MIEKADPRIRAVAIPVIAGIVVIGLVLIVTADAWRSAAIDWVLRDPSQSHSRAVALSIALAASAIVPVLAAAAYLWRFGGRVLRDGRFPPRRARLLVDMVVEEGEEAQRRGRMLQVLAIALGVAGLVFAVMFWRLIVLTGAKR